MAAVLFGLALLSGCDPSPYPEDLRYPLRTDLLVKDYEEKNIPELEPLGSVETTILRVREKNKDAVVDPTALPSDKLDSLDTELEKRFGTPAAPTVNISDKALIKTLSLDDETL